ncbi:MAG: HAD family acid phosphatase [Sandaracinaceae bacterium]
MLNRALLSVFACCLALLGCESPATGGVGPFGSGKVDGQARDLEPDLPAEGTLGTEVDEEYFLFSASAGSVVTIEITQAGSSRGLDTFMRVLGPMGPQGRAETEIAFDDEAGYGQLSKIESLELSEEGDYVIEVRPDPSGDNDFASPRRFRILLTEEAGVVAPAVSGDLPKEVHYVRNSAEYVGVVSQAYALATMRIEAAAAADELPADWAVIMDVDETILSNSQYRRERGLGMSTSWWQWVAREDARALPGADAFMDRVRELGGRVALVTNRHISQCDFTGRNLDAQGIEYDILLCQDGERSKQPRWDSVADGTASPDVGPVEVMMWIGDNIHDFPEMEQEQRHDPSAFSEFGHRFVIVPNPMSGSWVSNPQD